MRDHVPCEPPRSGSPPTGVRHERGKTWDPRVGRTGEGTEGNSVEDRNHAMVRTQKFVVRARYHFEVATSSNSISTTSSVHIWRVACSWGESLI